MMNGNGVYIMPFNPSFMCVEMRFARMDTVLFNSAEFIFNCIYTEFE